MAKSARRKSNKSSKAKNKTKTDPKLPKDSLSKFLENKIKVSEISNVCRIKDNFLWEKGGVQRFRINVWVEEYEDGRYCPKVYIKHSFFVQYDKKQKDVKDLTIEQTIDLETMKRSMF